MPQKKMLCVIISIITIFMSTAAIFGNNDTLEFVYRDVDISSGRVAGINAEFYFLLPEEWNDLITVDKVKLEKNGDMIDRLNFYCRSASGTPVRQLILSIIVFDRAMWRDNFYPYGVILKTNDYVFAVETGKGDGFTIKKDKEVFDAYFKPVSTISQIRDCIVLPSGHQEEDEYRIFVNGERLDSKVELIGGDGYFYLPLREICEALGYTVEWRENERAVEVIAENFYNHIYIEDGVTEYAKNILVVIKDGRTYVTTAYIFQVLRKTFDVDSRRNVYILSKQW